MEDHDLSAFTEDQRKVLFKILKSDDKAGNASKSDDQNDVVQINEFVKKDEKNLNAVANIWRNNGYVRGAKDRITLQQLREKDVEVTRNMRDNFSTDHPLLLPRVVSNIAREAIEPQLVLTPLLSRINFSAGTRVVFPSWGALAGAAADLSEGEEYPETTMELAGQSEAIIGKSGIAVKVSEEMVRYSQFDILSMHIRAAGRAMARLKERKVANLITTDYGNVIFDNTSASVKSTTGRNAAGAYNGTITLDDLFYAWSTMVNRGFPPNALIMHPFAWKIFAEEGIARAFGFVNGVSPLMWQPPQGSPGNASPWRMGNLNQNTYVSSPETLATTFTNIPSIFPTNFRIIITPYMPFTASTSRTDIILCDVNELGLLVVDEEMVTDEWDDPARDLRKIKFRERYGVAVQNDGKGIGLMKGIKIAKSVDFADRITVSLGTGDLGNSLTGDDSYNSVI